MRPNPSAPGSGTLGKLTFAGAFLAVGMAAALLGYGLGSLPAAGLRRPPVYPPDWVFGAIWTVLYPTMGVAAWHLQRARRASPGDRLAWRLYLLAFAVNVTWVPVVHASGSPVAGPAVMDVVTGTAFFPAAWAVARWNGPAFRWSLPVLVWGIITGLLKFWQLALNQASFSPAAWKGLEAVAAFGLVGLAVQAALVVWGLSRRRHP